MWHPSMAPTAFLNAECPAS
uniref:Uncharacterized protein n=1 Tax=Anguilla anguilla TaxID=7936 RepID=A0A0E9ULL1_ANGAN